MIWWGVVCFAVFGIGVTKSGFGSGVGLMLVPMMALAMSHIPGRGSDAALGLMLPLLVTGDLLAVWQYRRLFSLNIVKKLLPGTAVGVFLGGAMLYYLRHAGSAQIAESAVQIEIGVESILLVGLHWYRLWRGKVCDLLFPAELGEASDLLVRWRFHARFAAVRISVSAAGGCGGDLRIVAEPAYQRCVVQPGGLWCHVRAGVVHLIQRD